MDDGVAKAFRAAVNMHADELDRWLDSEESKSVGVTGSGGSESKGHESGRMIVRILRTDAADLTDDDAAQMKRVTGYVHRHLAQRPTKEPLEDSKWRYSLMNWGHDPLK